MFYGIYSIKYYHFLIINEKNFFINEPDPASPYYWCSRQIFLDLHGSLYLLIDKCLRKQSAEDSTIHIADFSNLNPYIGFHEAFDWSIDYIKWRPMCGAIWRTKTSCLCLLSNFPWASVRFEKKLIFSIWLKIGDTSVMKVWSRYSSLVWWRSPNMTTCD